MYNQSLIGTLSLIMIFTSVSAVEARNLRISAYAYAAQALLICALIGAFATQNSALWWWVVVAFFTKALITPWLLLWYVRRTSDREVRAIIGFGPSVVIALIIMVVFYKLTHTYADFLAPSAEATQGVFRTNLAVALTVFVIGLYAILSRRDAIKTVVGLALLENAVHLSLVSLAPGIRETALIGIATEVVVSVGLLLYIISGIYQKFGSTDTYKLSELHW